MRNRRLEEILAQAGLANSDLERERVKAARDEANGKQWAGALTGAMDTLVGAGFKARDAYKGNVSDQAEAEKAQALADHVGDVGHNLAGVGENPYYGETSADVAKSALPAEQESSWIDHLVGADSIRAKARAATQAGVAGQVQANRDKAQAEQASANALATKQADEEAKRAQEQANTDRSFSQNEDKIAADQNIKSLEEQDKRRALDLEAKKIAAKGTGGKPSVADAKGIETATHLQNAADRLDRLAALYEAGGIEDGLTGAAADKLPQEAWGDPRSEAHQLAGEAHLETPSVVSGAKRLNETELKIAKDAIVGDVGSSDSNAHKAANARRLAKLFREEAAGLGGTRAVTDAARQQTANAAAPHGQVGAVLGVGPMIRVRLADGRTGTIPATSFDPATMERL
jgi:hypothetical protein